jgi:CRP-like cAMP-binding protein
VKLTVVSNSGKEAIIALVGPGEFIGEECIASAHPAGMATAGALMDCTLLRIDRKEKRCCEYSFFTIRSFMNSIEQTHSKYTSTPINIAFQKSGIA